MKKERKVRFEELDALRGIAALFVVFFHFTMGRQEHNQFFKFGVTGVDLFFLISGFVIFMSLNQISKGTIFIINRVSRLYPTYWAAVSFTFSLIVFRYLFRENVNIQQSIIQYLGNLTMFQYYFGIPDLEAPYWTMIIEMIFYILMLFLFQLKLLKYINGIGLFFCAIIVGATLFYLDIKLVKQIFIWIPLLQFLPLFFAGIIFYKIHSQKGNNILRYSIIAFCLVCQLLLFPYVGKSSGFINQFEYNIMLSIYFIVFILFVNNKLEFIVNRVTLFFGKISYALYLIHQFISLGFFIPFFYKKYGINFWVVTILIDFPFLVAVATFITYKIEVPFSKKLKEKLLAVYT